MEDERPTRSKREERGSARKTSSGRGWAAASAAKKARSGFTENYKVEKEKGLLHFMEDGPYATFFEHWLRELPQGVKKSWTCIATDDEGTGCPLCEELDDTPAFRAAFDVVDMVGGTKPRLLTWVVSPEPWDRIADAHDDYGDLSDEDMYFAVSKSKQKNGRFAYKLLRVKAKEFEEDGWADVDPLSEDELDEFRSKLSTEKDIKYPTREELEEVLEQLED